MPSREGYLIDRRQIIAALSAGAIVMPGAIAKPTGDLIVETRSGKVRGVTRGNASIFKGIPYAFAKRYMSPEDPAPWAGIRDCIDYGPIAPQTNPHPAGPSPIILAHLPRPAGAPSPISVVEREDCQRLNIWTPSGPEERLRPVMIWLHGGFFSSGSGASGDGEALAQRGDVVVVSINHRLNVLGFAHLDDLPGGDFRHSGNLGMLDILAAIRWVRANIAAFGGDPNQIMVFGESGGGMKTGWLMASPVARGLFKRAAIQSGPGKRMMARELAQRVTEKLLVTLQIAARDAADLRSVPLERLMGAYFTVAAACPPRNFTDLASFAPVLDPVLLPHHPFDPKAPPQSADVPLLIGWNRQEMSFFMANDPEAFNLNEAELIARFQKLFGEHALEVLELYRTRNPGATSSDLYLRSLSDQQIMMPTLDIADRQGALPGSSVYVYRFDWCSPAMDGKLGALHTLEAPFVFDDVTRQKGLTGGGPSAALLANQMSSAWVNFATTGQPSAQGLSPWPRYQQGGAIMVINDKSALSTNLMRQEKTLLATIDREG